MKQKLKLDDFRPVGSGLERPEGICVDSNGILWAADRKTLLARIAMDGSVLRFGQGGAMPNGLVDQEGRILIAEYEHGTLRRFDPVTQTTGILLTEVGGRKISRANYPAIDPEGRIWCTSSTAMADDLAALRTKADDGFVFVLEADGSSRIVAEGLHFANGLAFSRDFQWLYIVESSTRRIVRAPWCWRPPCFSRNSTGAGGHAGWHWVRRRGKSMDNPVDREKCLGDPDRSAWFIRLWKIQQERVLGRPTNVCLLEGWTCAILRGVARQRRGVTRAS